MVQISVNRENVVWQSADGTWSRGFYAFEQLSYSRDGDNSEPDPEWDVEYDFGEFNWASCGHATAEAAWNSWDGANPGGGSEYAYDPEGARDDHRNLDVMALELELKQQKLEGERRARGERTSWLGGTSAFNGASKATTPNLVGLLEKRNRAVADMTRSREYYRLNSYANVVHLEEAKADRDAVLADLEQRPDFTDAEYERVFQEHYDNVVTQLEALVEKTNEDRRPRSGYYGGGGYQPLPSLRPTEELLAAVRAEADEFDAPGNITALPVPKKVSRAGAPNATCGYFMPRAKRRCTLPPLHRSAHQ